MKNIIFSIAAYNAKKILNCLDSLIRSNVLEKLDIIVVNDGSKIIRQRLSKNTLKIQRFHSIGK